MRRSDPIIIGAGPAGCAAAIALAEVGIRATVFERQKEIGDALCGGFLSWRTLQSLETLGVSVKGHKVSRLRLVLRDRQAEADLPAGAMGVSRHMLDTHLAARAKESGAALEMGVSVSGVDGSGAIIIDGSPRPADSLFVATGKTDLRGLGRARTGDDPALGLRVRIAPNAALAKKLDGFIELHLFEGGYAGLMLQEDGSANLCLAVRKSRFAQTAQNADQFLRTLANDHPILGERLGPGWQGSVDAVGAVPYGWRAHETRAGLFRLGDQAAVIPSIAGEGNGIALASGRAAAKAWLEGGPDAAPAFQARFDRAVARPVGLASLIWQLAERPFGARIGIMSLNALPALAKRLARATRIPH